MGGLTATKERIKETASTISGYVCGDDNTILSKYLAGRKTSKTIRPITDATKLQQFENYRNGKGLLLNFHPVHHAGTTFCKVIGGSGGPVASKNYPEISPSFACWLDTDGVVGKRYSPTDRERFHKTTPVPHQATGKYLKDMRKHFHMTSWEYDGVGVMERNVSDTDWEHPDLLSVVITREPLSRVLAGGRTIKELYPGYNNGTLGHAGWWDFASNSLRYQTDNFFLRMLAGKKRRNVRKKAMRQRNKYYKNSTYLYTDDELPRIEDLRRSFDIQEEHYETAVEMLHRFTVVLDIACLDDGLDALARLLDLNMTFVAEKQTNITRTRSYNAKKREFKRTPVREQIGYEDVYDYLVEKNRFDIQLYEYSKTISLVDCNS